MALKKLSKLKVGLTVLIGIILLLFFVTVVGTESNLFTNNYSLKFFVTDIEGLANGSMVTLGGMKIGQVKKFDFTQIDGVNGIIITISMPTEYQKMITEKSVATIKGIGVLGDKYVDISIGKPTEKPLDDEQFISVESTFNLENGVQNIESKATATFENIDSVLKELKNITLKINNGEGTVGKLINSSSLYDNLNSVSDKFNKITNAIIEKRGTLGKTIYDDALYSNLQYTTSNIKTLTEELKSGKGTIGKLLTSDSLYIDMKSISEKLDSLMTNVNGNSTVGKLLNDDEIYNKLIITIKEFNNLLIDIRQNPKKYINLSIF